MSDDVAADGAAAAAPDDLTRVTKGILHALALLDSDDQIAAMYAAMPLHEQLAARVLAASRDRRLAQGAASQLRGELHAAKRATKEAHAALDAAGTAPGLLSDRVATLIADHARTRAFLDDANKVLAAINTFTASLGLGEVGDRMDVVVGRVVRHLKDTEHARDSHRKGASRVTNTLQEVLVILGDPNGAILDCARKVVSERADYRSSAGSLTQTLQEVLAVLDKAGVAEGGVADRVRRLRDEWCAARTEAAVLIMANQSLRNDITKLRADLSAIAAAVGWRMDDDCTPLATAQKVVAQRDAAVHECNRLAAASVCRSIERNDTEETCKLLRGERDDAVRRLAAAQGARDNFGAKLGAKLDRIAALVHPLGLRASGDDVEAVVRRVVERLAAARTERDHLFTECSDLVTERDKAVEALHAVEVHIKPLGLGAEGDRVADVVGRLVQVYESASRLVRAYQNGAKPVPVVPVVEWKTTGLHVNGKRVSYVVFRGHAYAVVEGSCALGFADHPQAACKLAELLAGVDPGGVWSVNGADVLAAEVPRICLTTPISWRPA